MIHFPQPFLHFRQRIPAIWKFSYCADRFGPLNPADRAIVTQHVFTPADHPNPPAFAQFR